MTSGSAFGNHITPQAADVISNTIVADPLNADLQWSEGSYRGFFTLTLNTTHANATYWAMRNTSTLSRGDNDSCIDMDDLALGSANLDAFASATFIVKSGKSLPNLSRGTICSSVHLHCYRHKQTQPPRCRRQSSCRSAEG